MKVINNSKKIKVNVGDVIKYWDKTSPYPAYAMIIRTFDNKSSAVVLSDKACPDNVGHVVCQFSFATPKVLWSEPKRGWVEPETASIQRYTSDNPTTVFQEFCQKWDHVEKVPFFGVEGYPEDCEAWENSHE